MATTEEILGPGGPLSRALSAYESREGQLEMARAVERSLREERILFCEAGTGTGKTLAYLVPALLSGKKGDRLDGHARAAGADLSARLAADRNGARRLVPDRADEGAFSNYVCAAGDVAEFPG